MRTEEGGKSQEGLKHSTPCGVDEVSIHTHILRLRL
jgi:hypothetical protein